MAYFTEEHLVLNGQYTLSSKTRFPRKICPQARFLGGQIFSPLTLCKSQANKYLTICDIESANRKVKLEIDNSKMPPGKKCKVSYVICTAEERACIGCYSSQHRSMAASWYLTKNFAAQYLRNLHDALRKSIY